MGISWRTGFAALLPLAAACNVISGAGELTIRDTCSNCPPGEVNAVSEVGNSSGSRDGGPRTDAGVTQGGAQPMNRPSFCSGLVLYARVDGTFTSSDGVAPRSPAPQTFGDGRFGQAGLAQNEGAYYPAVADGGAVYSADEGTVALWVKPTWQFPSSSSRVFFKPLSDGTGSGDNAGPRIRIDTDTGKLEIVNNNPRGPMTSAGGAFAEVGAAWQDQAWNHLVGTWSTTKTPTLTLTLNGGMGRFETSDAWAPEHAPPVYARFGSDQASIDAWLDDLAIWSRVLTTAEIGAIYLSGKPIGDVCGR